MNPAWLRYLYPAAAIVFLSMTVQVCAEADQSSERESRGNQLEPVAVVAAAVAGNAGTVSAAETPLAARDRPVLTPLETAVRSESDDSAIPQTLVQPGADSPVGLGADQATLPDFAPENAESKAEADQRA